MRDVYQQAVEILPSVWRYRWLALSTACAISLIGALVVALQEDIYEASARVYVDTSSELRNVLGAQVVDSDVEDQLSFVRESMLGRVQLEKVASLTGLISEAQTEEEMLRLLALLRARTTITSVTPQRQWNEEASGSTYTITFSHESRQVAINFVDTMLDTFLETTLGSELSGSDDARRFLETQINEYEDRLRTAEGRLAEFNQRNYDRLPNMQGGYFSQLQQELRDLNVVQQSLRQARSRLSRVEQQIRGEAPRVIVPGEIAPGSLDGRINELEANLDELLLRYTARHPDVVATRENLKALIARRDAQVASLNEESPTVAGSNNPVYQELQISKNEIEEEIASLQADIRNREERVDGLRNLIDEMPEVEAELARLNRDYAVVHEHYQSLLNSLERERLSRSVLQSEQVDFRIIDPPGADAQPVAPNRLLMLLIVFAGSCGAGLGVAYVLCLFNPLVASSDGLVKLVGLPLIGTVTNSWAGDARKKLRRSYIGFSSALLAFSILYMSLVAYESFGAGLRTLL